jgi:integrase
MAEGASRKGGEKVKGFTFSDAVKTAIETGDTSDLKAISEIANQRLAALKAHRATEQTKARRKRGDGGTYQRGRVWWIFYTHNGKKIWESSRSGKEPDAQKLLKNRMGEIVTGNFLGTDAERVTVAELADDVVNDYRINQQDSLDKAIRSANRIKNFFGSAKAHTVRGDLVKKYIAKRQDENAANGTINRELAFLKRSFNLGIRNERIVRKPYIPLLQENNVRKGFFEYPEFVAVRDACPDYFKPVVTFAYYTGWREGEIFSLRWNQIDLQAQEIRLDAGETKNDEGRIIMLEGELLETLQAQWERRKVTQVPGFSPTLLCQYVFHRNGKQLKDIRDVWWGACVAAGLGQMIEVDGKKKYQGKLFHDFRRTGCRDMIRAGIPERVAMQISGHKTRSVFDRYNIVSTNDLKRAAKKRWEHVQEQEERAKKVVAMNRGKA